MSTPITHSDQLRTIARAAWKASGLTQGSIAREIGYTEQWLRHLLSGQIHDYGSDFLEGFARVTNMAPASRVRMMRLVAPHLDLRLTAPVPADVREIADEMELTPAASMLYDLDFTVLHGNRAAHRWLPHLAQEPNLARWVLTSDEAQERLWPWRSWATLLWSELAARWVEHPDSDDLGRLYAELKPAAAVLPSIEPRGLHGHVLDVLLPGAKDFTTIRIMGLKPTTRPPSRIEAMTWRLYRPGAGPRPAPQVPEPEGLKTTVDAEDVARRAQELTAGLWRLSGGSRAPRG